MSETEAAAALKRLHRQVERLTSVRGSLAGQREERRAEVEALEDEAFELQRRVDELLLGGPGRIALYLLLIGAAIAVFFIYRHTQVDLYVRAPVPRSELNRLVELLDLPEAYSVQSGTRISFERKLAPVERNKLHELLDELLKARGPAARPRFWLETTRPGREPIVTRLALKLQEGGRQMLIRSHGLLETGTAEKYCTYSVPLVSPPPDEHFDDDGLGSTPWIHTLDEPSGRALAKRRIRVTPAAYSPLAAKLDVEKISGDFHLIREFWRQPTSNTFFVGGGDNAICAEEILQKGSALLHRALIFPELTRTLVRWKIDNVLF